VRLGWLPTNPAEHYERVKLNRSGDFNALTPEEVMAVTRAAQDETYAALFVVAAFTGLRQGELRALRWRDVDWATATVDVRRNIPAHGKEKVPKSKVVRAVPLIDAARRVLEDLSGRRYHTGPNDRVFKDESGKPLDDKDMRERFYVVLDDAGLGDKRHEQPPLRFHDLRHTFGTAAVRVWDIRKVQGYMRHCNIETTMRYVHHVPKHTDAGALNGLVEAELDVSQGVLSTV
jgi:integrase